MAAKKREIYARAAVQLRTHERPIRAEKMCPGAMGLYLFLLLDSRGEQTAGDVAELVAMCSWGAPGSYRRKQAEALIAVGLVDRRDDRLVVVKYDEHNDTPVDIALARDAASKRKRKSRGHDDVTRDGRDGHAEVPISISYSLSGSGSSGEVQEGGSPPGWWAGACDTAEQSQGPVGDRVARWLEYDASRDRKGWARNHRDAVGWLVAVLRGERDRARSGPKGAAEITKQPFDPDAPWMKVGA